jgi:ATP-dependent RNA helicase DHX29
MSATVDADKIASYMGGCPVIQVPGRTFPVTPYFLEDAVEISQYRLDQDSDSPYVDRMQRKARYAASDEVADLEDAEGENVRSVYASGYSKQTVSTLQAMNESVINFGLLVQLLETICFSDQQLQAFSSAILVFLPSLDTIRKLVDLLESHPAFGSNDFRIFALHSSISSEQQARVFEIPPRGVRKIVVSTNIAETGVTIPGKQKHLPTAGTRLIRDSRRHRRYRFWSAQGDAL